MTNYVGAVKPHDGMLYRGTAYLGYRRDLSCSSFRDETSGYALLAEAQGIPLYLVSPYEPISDHDILFNLPRDHGAAIGSKKSSSLHASAHKERFYACTYPPNVVEDRVPAYVLRKEDNSSTILDSDEFRTSYVNCEGKYLVSSGSFKDYLAEGSSASPILHNYYYDELNQTVKGVDCAMHGDRTTGKIACDDVFVDAYLKSAVDLGFCTPLATPADKLCGVSFGGPTASKYVKRKKRRARREASPALEGGNSTSRIFSTASYNSSEGISSDEYNVTSGEFFNVTEEAPYSSSSVSSSSPATKEKIIKHSSKEAVRTFLAYCEEYVAIISDKIEEGTTSSTPYVSSTLNSISIDIADFCYSAGSFISKAAGIFCSSAGLGLVFGAAAGFFRSKKHIKRGR